MDHPHAFLKIKYPAQAPRILITSLYDDFIPGLDVNGVTFDQQSLETLIRKQEQVIVPAQEKKEEVVEIIKEVEVPKVEEKIEEKVEENVEEDLEADVLAKANELESIYGVDFFEAYQFVKMHTGISLE